jgi:hypothetical protein
VRPAARGIIDCAGNSANCKGIRGRVSSPAAAIMAAENDETCQLSIAVALGGI